MIPPKKWHIAWFITFIILMIFHHNAHSADDAINDMAAAPDLSIEQIGTRVTISWNSVPDSTGYRLCYAAYPETDLAEYIDLGNERHITIDLPITIACNVAVQPVYDDVTGPMSEIRSFGIKKARKVGAGTNSLHEEIKRIMLCVFDLNGNLLQEKRDMNGDGGFEKTINYGYELFHGYPYPNKEEFQLVNDIWLISRFDKTDGAPFLRSVVSSGEDSPASLIYYINRYSVLAHGDEREGIYICAFDREWEINREVSPTIGLTGSTSRNRYFFDDAGNIIKEEKGLDREGKPASTYEYAYDGQNRRVQELLYNDGGLYMKKSFAYDDEGRLSNEVACIGLNSEEVVEYDYTYY